MERVRRPAHQSAPAAVLVPRSRPAATRRLTPRTSPAPGRISRSALRGLTVMVVEDHEDDRELLRQILEHAGARVLLAEHGRVALRLLETTALPDIVLCDLLMPELDGLGLARHIEADLRWKRIPVLAVTALGAAADYIRT